MSSCEERKRNNGSLLKSWQTIFKMGELPIMLSYSTAHTMFDWVSIYASVSGAFYGVKVLAFGACFMASDTERQHVSIRIMKTFFYLRISETLTNQMT